MSRISTLKSSIRTAAAALVFVGLLSPANATYQHDALSVFPDLPISTIADHADAKAAVARNRPMVLTSRRPWLAPVGHRQPRRADVPNRRPSRHGSASNSSSTRCKGHSTAE